MSASSFTEHSQDETFDYQAPDAVQGVFAAQNDPSNFGTFMIIGSKQYQELGQLLGQPVCWQEGAASGHDTMFSRRNAMSALVALLGPTTVRRRGDTFTFGKVVPAPLASVMPLFETTTVNQKPSSRAEVKQEALEEIVRSKGLLRITTTVRTAHSFVVGIVVDEQGSFVTASNAVISKGLRFSTTFEHFDSSPPLVAPSTDQVIQSSANGSFIGAGAPGSPCSAEAIGEFPARGVTVAVQNQYLALSKPLLAANDAFVTAVVTHYATVTNAQAKVLGRPLVAALTTANEELAHDQWPAGVRGSIKQLIGARRTFIADITDLPTTGYVTSAWTKKLYNDGATAGNIEDAILMDLGLPQGDSS